MGLREKLMAIQRRDEPRIIVRANNSLMPGVEVAIILGSSHSVVNAGKVN